MKNILKYTISFVIIILLSTWFNFDNTQTFSHVLTFLSVTTGFTITALSIIATSDFSKVLYKKESVNDNSKTLLHELVNKFEKSTLTFTTVIILILIFSFIEPINFRVIIYFNTKISFKWKKRLN